MDSEKEYRKSINEKEIVWKRILLWKMNLRPHAREVFLGKKKKE